MAPTPRPHKGRKSDADRSGPNGGGYKGGRPSGDRARDSRSGSSSRRPPVGGKRAGPPPARRDEQGPVGPLGPGVRIIHEDDDLIVVDKPPHMLTVDVAEEGRDNLAYRLKKYLTAHAPRLSRSRQRDLEAAGKSSTLPGPLPGIIHRLDKEASGLLVFSKSRRGFGWLKDDFKSKRVHRMYIAVVEGVMGQPGDAGTIQTFIREGDDGRVIVEP
ncbi:MAG: pseudouridine synthase, partial [Phycisphaerales bacterium]|nr:pseudouridine synthase [Phycisphaerales bacterium]